MEHQHTTKHLFNSPLLWGAGSAAAITFSPYVLPSIGIGSKELATEIVKGLCGAPESSGLAAVVSGGLSHIPLIGESLVAGGLSTALWSGGIGIGGLLLSKWVERFESPNAKGLCLSKIIRWASVATSILIALPAILTGLSVGLSFLAGAIGMGIFGTAVLGSVVQTFLGNTLGSLSTTGFAATGVGLATLTASHLLTCGVALLPASLSAVFGGKKEEAETTARAYAMQLVAHGACTKGQPCELQFKLVDKDSGRILSEQELATVHTKKVHTMIVDSGLADYHHIHPAYDPATKTFRCSFTPNLQAPYAMWNDFTVAGDQQPTQVRTDIAINRSAYLSPRISHASSVTVDGLNIHITPASPLRAGQSTMVTVRITGADGKAVTNLEPIMGAYAHLAGFSADGQHFIHSHPMGAEPKNEAERGVGQLQFHLTPAAAGMSKFFLQIQQEGRIVTIPFGQMVSTSLTYTDRVQRQPQSHAGHAMA